MSNLVLYRKYRPLTFAQVANQDHVQTTLVNAVLNNRVGHAYLFTGPRGSGKTTMARIFARAINCANRTGAEPCNACEVCKGFLEATSLDLLEIDAASHTGVDNVRELIEHVQFAPSQAKYKVIIIDEVHMLSKPAFNALLKTLEEPPKHAVFILATTETHKVPATIISRTQRFDFKKVSILDLVKLLKFICTDNQVTATDAALIEVATAADGSFRDGLSLLDQVINYAGKEITEELVEQVLGLTGTKTTSEFLDLLIGGETAKAVDFISNLSFNGRDLYQFERDFLEYLRKVLLVKVGAKSETGFAPETLAKLNAQTSLVDLVWLTRVIEIFQKAESEIKWSSIQSLPLELATVEACLLKEGSDVAQTAVSASQVAISTPVEEKPEPKPIASESEVSNTPSATGSFSLSEIMEKWPKVLEKIKEYNHSLIASLKLAQPVAVEEGRLVLTFGYKFHKEAVDARKNLVVIEMALEEVFGQRVLLKTVMQQDWKGVAPVMPDVKEVVPDTTLASALKIMGGEVE